MSETAAMAVITAPERDLLARYVADRSESAFAEIVSRYANLVYRAARRQCPDEAMAEDVTQAVFLLLARRAPHIQGEVKLAGWLIRAAQFAARDAVRSERRRRRREREVAQMNRERVEQANVTFDDLKPLLDDALGRLKEVDRGLVALRYLEGVSSADIAAMTGSNVEAVRKKIDRAMAKLRSVLSRRGMNMAPAALPAALLGGASSGMTPAPLVGKLIAVAARDAATAATAAGAIADGAARLMLWAKMKFAAAVVLAAVVATATAGGIAHLAAASGATPAAAATTITIDDIKFDPIGPGKNVVHILATNKSSVDHSLVVIVEAQSAGRTRKGSYGRGYREVKDGQYVKHGPTLPAGRGSVDIRSAFAIPEPFSRAGQVVVEIYELPGDLKKPMLTRRVNITALPQRQTKWDTLPSASAEPSQAAKDVFNEMQTRLKLGLYGRAQALFTWDWQFVENTPIREWFRRRMYPKDVSSVAWTGTQLLTLQAGDVLADGDRLVLLATSAGGKADQIWPIEIARENGVWMIDWVHTPKETAGLRRPATAPAATTAEVRR